MKKFSGLAALTLMVLFSCGGVERTSGTGGGKAAGGGSATGGGSAGATSGTYACDIQVAGTHSCTEYSWTGGVYSTTAWQQACAGSTPSSCSHSGAVFGCKISTHSGAVSVSTTTWYYSGLRSTYESACSASGGTAVSP